MIYVIDSIELKKGKTEEYLHAFESEYLPRATQRGLRLVACWQTPSDAGVEEELVFIWSVDSWQEWSRIRWLTLPDPATDEWLHKTLGLRVGGSRRFYLPTRLSPLK